VVPLFALANAGVPLSRGSLAAAVGSPVTLAYPDPAPQDQARVGILAGSLLAAAVGASLLHGNLASPARPAGTPKEEAA
jgi:Na+/H+ antiporter NhaA